MMFLNDKNGLSRDAEEHEEILIYCRRCPG